MQSIAQAVSFSAYPGRGILMGLSADGTQAMLAYFIMGRSENSRNRVFVADGSGLRTQAYDQSKLTDPSLIIYAPVRVLGDTTIITNGDQTDTVYDFLARGESFFEALRTREFEPDAPNYTPRISGAATIRDGRLSYQLSILRRTADGGCERPRFTYPTPMPGCGHLIHTYQCEGDPLPSFRGKPRALRIEGTLGAFTQMLWNSLDVSNRISLFTRSIDLASGATHTHIINKHV